MVSGKPSNQSAQEVDSSPTIRLLLYIYTHRRVGVRSCDSSSTCKLDTLFVSVKYVLVSVKLVCVYVKLLKT
jgi:hypothetical protein